MPRERLACQFALCLLFRISRLVLIVCFFHIYQHCRYIRRRYSGDSSRLPDRFRQYLFELFDCLSGKPVDFFIINARCYFDMLFFFKPFNLLQLSFELALIFYLNLRLLEDFRLKSRIKPGNRLYTACQVGNTDFRPTQKFCQGNALGKIRRV